MTQPLDLTSAGRARSAPPPQPPPSASPSPVRSRKPRTKIVIALALTVAVAAILASVLVIRSGRKTLAKPSPTFISDQRFCQLWDVFAQFSAAAGVAPGTPVAGKVQTDQLRKGVTQFAGSVAELERVAPRTITSDVQVVVSSVQQAATGDLSAIHSPAFTNAGQRVVQADRTLITEKNGPCQQINGSELAH